MSLELLAYISIPIVAGLVGFITNWLAIKLTFYPLEFVGIRPIFGWQGIIPSKAKTMATMCVDSTLSRIGSVSDIVEQMDPVVITQHILNNIKPRVSELVDEIMRARYKTIWHNLPSSVKQMVYQRVEQQLPKVMDSLLEDISPKIESLFDVKQLVIDTLEKDTSLLNRIFLDCGKQEFSFIIKSGLWFGFLFGVPQLVFWYLVPHPAVLPAFGLVVGWATNWLALNLIFRPLEPRKILGFKIQGLFLQRQNEVSEAFCKIVTEEILTVSQIVESMLHGPEGHRTQAIVQSHFENLVDEAAGIIKPIAQVALGPEGFAELKMDTGLKAIDLSSETLNDPVFNQDRAQDVQNLMADRMKQLPPEDFQKLLRPCFKEDETKLIIIGSILGGLAGLAQATYIFGMSVF